MGLLDDFEKSLDPKKYLLEIKEDEDYDGTWATSVKKPEVDLDESGDVSPNRRKMRDLKLLEETDEKYKGTKVSRKDIFGDECEPTLRSKISSDDEEMDDEEEVVDEEEDVDDEEQDNESVDLDDEEEIDNEVSEDGDNNIVVLNRSTDTSKGDAVKKQMTMWDKLMRVTIKAHSAMRNFNQLPRDQMAKDLENQKEAKQNIITARKNILEALKMLVDVEGDMVSKLTATEDSDNEEIPSSDEEDGSENEDDEEDEIEDEENDDIDSDDDDEKEVEEKVKKDNFQIKTGRKFNSNELSRKFKDRHKSLEPFRMATLKKWDEKTRLISVKPGQDFSKFGSNISRQIERIMADKGRLLRKSQTKRGDCTRIGDTSDSNYDVEVFDDTDFYQTLLSDLIERKTVDTNDPIQMSKQWLEIEKLRQTKKKKKKVNQKASKGRKCMFVTIPKLVNYHPAQPETVTWSNERRTELFKSLFVN
uniref:Protein AATF (inferred by orthology to a human protein) n=1 Tax=Strongyloides venezuelensis TaxID=75913 RepID=A0A0K0G312_STRVS